jgi:hypothetical protein
MKFGESNILLSKPIYAGFGVLKEQIKQRLYLLIEKNDFQNIVQHLNHENFQKCGYLSPNSCGFKFWNKSKCKKYLSHSDLFPEGVFVVWTIPLQLYLMNIEAENFKPLTGVPIESESVVFIADALSEEYLLSDEAAFETHPEIPINQDLVRKVRCDFIDTAGKVNHIHYLENDANMRVACISCSYFCAHSNSDMSNIGELKRQLYERANILGFCCKSTNNVFVFYYDTNPSDVAKRIEHKSDRESRNHVLISPEHLAYILETRPEFFNVLKTYCLQTKISQLVSWKDIYLKKASRPTGWNFKVPYLP